MQHELRLRVDAPLATALARRDATGRGRAWLGRAGNPPETRNRRMRLFDRCGAQEPSAAKGDHLRDEEIARLEAALFYAREPVPLRRLAKLARLPDGTRAMALIRQLNALYDSAGSAFRVERLAGGFQLLTRAPFGPWLRRLLEAVPETRLSSAAMETLAIVAYRQPVTRTEVEGIRGVGSEEMLRQLLERDFIAVGGRSDELGRPNVYVTTRRFLQAFGLGQIEELPPVDLSASETAADSPPGSAAEPATDDEPELPGRDGTPG